jgi:hypothetical protein
MYMPGIAPEAFVKWLNEQMEKKGWTVRETARRAEIVSQKRTKVL